MNGRTLERRTGARWTLALGAAAVLALPAALAHGAAGVPPGKDGRIVYENLNTDDSSADIFSVSADGSGVTNLTPNTADIDFHDPAWSPDGKRVAFTALPNSDPKQAAVYVANANGSGLRKLAASGFEHTTPAWSPDGKLIAFSKCTFLLETGDCSSAQLVVVRPTGKGLRLVTRAPKADTSSLDYEAAWSPSGKQLAFTRRSNFTDFSLWTVGLDGKALRRIYADDSSSEYNPSWAPNGKRIAFASDTLGLDAIFTVNTLGRTRQKVLEDTTDPEDPESSHGAGLTNPVYSPSGKWILYTGGDNLSRVTPAGANATQVTQDGGDSGDWARIR